MTILVTQYEEATTSRHTVPICVFCSLLKKLCRRLSLRVFQTYSGLTFGFVAGAL